MRNALLGGAGLLLSVLGYVGLAVLRWRPYLPRDGESWATWVRLNIAAHAPGLFPWWVVHKYRPPFEGSKQYHHRLVDVARTYRAAERRRPRQPGHYTRYRNVGRK